MAGKPERDDFEMDGSCDWDIEETVKKQAVFNHIDLLAHKENLKVIQFSFMMNGGRKDENFF